MTEEELRRQILETFGVTEEEVTALDEAMGGPAAREEERRWREEVIPQRRAAVLAELNGQLHSEFPDLKFVWDVP